MEPTAQLELLQTVLGLVKTGKQRVADIQVVYFVLSWLIKSQPNSASLTASLREELQRLSASAESMRAELGEDASQGVAQSIQAFLSVLEEGPETPGGGSSRPSLRLVPKG